MVASFGGLFGDSSSEVNIRLVPGDRYKRYLKVRGDSKAEFLIRSGDVSDDPEIINSRTLEKISGLPKNLFIFDRLFVRCEFWLLGEDRLFIFSQSHYLIIQLLEGGGFKVIEKVAHRFGHSYLETKMMTVDDVVVWNDLLRMHCLGKLQQEKAVKNSTEEGEGEGLQEENGTELGDGLGLSHVNSLWLVRHFDGICGPNDDEKYDFSRLGNGNYLFSAWREISDSEGSLKLHFLMLEICQKTLEVIKAQSYPSPGQFTTHDDFFVDFDENEKMTVYQLKVINSKVNGTAGRWRGLTERWLRLKST